jgi:type I restriction enzyme M protein
VYDEHKPHIAWADTLIEPKLLENDKLMKFEVVVANPPFSLDKWGADKSDYEAKTYNRWHRGVPPKSKGDYAFISHMIEISTENTGRVGVVVPHGVLFRMGSEGKIRKALIEENLLDAVIGLPQNLFFGTSIPATILIFRRDRGNNSNVLFIDASREFDQEKTQNKIREDTEVQKIVDTYQARKSVDRYAYLATWEEIKGNNYNLNISRYVDTFEEKDDVDINVLQKEISKLEQEIINVHSEMEQCIKDLGL